jgi:hypothetical protein
MRDTLPTLQSTIEEHIGRHQSMVQVRAVDVLVMIEGLSDELMIGLLIPDEMIVTPFFCSFVCFVGD